MPVEQGSEYVALGSSFAAGPGLSPRTAGAPRASGRSDSNYAHIAAGRLGLTLKDVTYSGATIEDVLGGTAGRPPQIDALGPATRLVTVTAGGNDIGYLPALTLASFPRPLRSIPTLRRRVTDFTDPASTDERFRVLESSLTALIRAVQDRAPDAQVVLVDYLTILPPNTPDDRGLDVLRSHPGGDLVTWGKGVASRLSATFASVTSTHGGTFLEAGARSREHHAWSPTPWTRQFHLSLRGGAPFHPNAAGMAAVAEMLVDGLS